MILALIFALTISSESNRNFMRAPEWVPHVVGSGETFGTTEHMANPYPWRFSENDVGAIAAIYDAFYERAYFGSVGPSNNWQEAADDHTGINVFKVGKNFDFFCKCLVYTNDDGTVVGDTNGTGLVMTDSHRILEFDNLQLFSNAHITTFSATKECRFSTAQHGRPGTGSSTGHARTCQDHRVKGLSKILLSITPGSMEAEATMVRLRSYRSSRCMR